MPSSPEIINLVDDEEEAAPAPNLVGGHQSNKRRKPNNSTGKLDDSNGDKNDSNFRIDVGNGGKIDLSKKEDEDKEEEEDKNSWKQVPSIVGGINNKKRKCNNKTVELDNDKDSYKYRTNNGGSKDDMEQEKEEFVPRVGKIIAKPFVHIGIIKTGPELKNESSGNGGNSVDHYWNILYDDEDKEDMNRNEMSKWVRFDKLILQIGNRKKLAPEDIMYLGKVMEEEIKNNTECYRDQKTSLRKSITHNDDGIENFGAAATTITTTTAGAGTTTAAATTMTEIDSKSIEYYKSTAEYVQAKNSLCWLMGINEEEVVAALNTMIPGPYKHNTAIELIHEAKQNDDGNPGADDEQDGLFVPKIGTRLRRLLHGSTYYSKVTGFQVSTEPDGREIPLWTTEDIEGNEDEMDYMELLNSRASRPMKPHWSRGRQFCSLELFSGVGAVTQAFAERKWRVRSIDNSQKSNATDKIDIMEVKYENFGMVCDFIHGSPMCTTNTNMACGTHRQPKFGLYEKTPLALLHNVYFCKMAHIMRWTKEINPHLIVLIENPVGALKYLPMMKLLGEQLELLEPVLVDYCAFGVDYQKPTYFWTNDFGLRSFLSEYRCKCGKKHEYGVQSHKHQINVSEIPQALAAEVAQYVDSRLYLDRRHKTKPIRPTQAQIDTFNNIAELATMDDTLATMDDRNGNEDGDGISSVTDSNCNTDNAIHDFLASLQLPPDSVNKYVNKFLANGVTEVDHMKFLTEDDLQKDIGIILGHRRRILRRLENM